MNVMDSASSLAPKVGTVKLPQKRPRPVLSCLECRRKKLKCSRTMPCVQCTKTGRASRCSYNEYPGEATSPSPTARDVSHLQGGRARKIVRSEITEQHEETRSPIPGSDTQLSSVTKPGIIEDLQSRVEKLEHQFKTGALKQNHTRDYDTNEGRQTQRYNMSSVGMVRLRDSATRYHGQNQKVALLNHVCFR